MALSPTPFVFTYFTDDVGANRKFYGEVLGFELRSEHPDLYFVCGSGRSRLQILRTDDRPGRTTVSSGLVMLGFDSGAELAAFREGAIARGAAHDGEVFSDPDGRLVISQVFDRENPFHD